MTGRRARRTTLVTVVLLAFLVGAGLFARWIAGQLAIDACLDSGGRWSHERSVCERG